eukprot:6343409-Heterocapsa_arctica.AAC.1
MHPDPASRNERSPPVSGSIFLISLLRLDCLASCALLFREGPGTDASPILTPACGLGRSSVGSSCSGASMIPSAGAGMRAAAVASWSGSSTIR